jgi:Plasmid pRiA4b ORF-3-like protein
MPIFKFRVSWQEDDNIQRDIEILSGQTFMDLHQCIKKCFLLKDEWHATIGVLNEVGRRVYSIDTKVEKNIKGAEFLSAAKTPIGALVSHPSQEFIYALENDKEWDFLIELKIVDKADADISLFPRVVRIEGISPMELGAKKGNKKEKLIDTDDKYDLENQEGFGNEGDDDEGGSGFTIEGGDTGGPDAGGLDDF